jgi:multiple sugar transport system ATP-binding protein
MRAEIARLHTRLAATMIYVTHDQAEALTLGQRVAAMKAGVIHQVADPATLYRQPANLFVAGFIGSPPMNFFHGTLLAKGDTLFFQEQTARNPAAPNPSTVQLDDASAPPLRPYVGKSVVFGIRPEDISCGLHQPVTPPARTVEALVEVLQPMGSEAYLYLASHAHSFVARVRATDRLSLNQKVSLIFDMRHAHFFDPASETAIV